MPIYKLKDLKSKGRFQKPRELELPDGVSRKIWIPEEGFLYHRVHFGIKTFTKYSNSKYDVMECTNQNFGEDGKGCPICKEVQELWAQWKKADTKEAKKAVTDKINRMTGEYFFFNAIDLESENKQFVSVQFTKSKKDDLIRIGEIYGIDNVIWLYKKKVTGEGKVKKIEYTLTELTEQDEMIAKYKTKLDEWKSREYEKGGPVDLERAYLRNIRTPEQMLEVLNGGGDDDKSDESDLNYDASKKSQASTQKKEEKPKVDIDESVSLSLDDINDPLDSKKSTETTSVDSLDLDSNLGLDDLSLDSLESPKKKIKVSAQMVNEKRADKVFIEKVVDFLVNSGKMKRLDDYVTNLKTAYAVLKSGEIEMEE